MTANGGELVARTLAAAGVRHAFGDAFVSLPASPGQRKVLVRP